VIKFSPLNGKAANANPVPIIPIKAECLEPVVAECLEPVVAECLEPVVFGLLPGLHPSSKDTTTANTQPKT
jgi:hypothetical protein